MLSEERCDAPAVHLDFKSIPSPAMTLALACKERGFRLVVIRIDPRDLRPTLLADMPVGMTPVMAVPDLMHRPMAPLTGEIVLTAVGAEVDRSTIGPVIGAELFDWLYCSAVRAGSFALFTARPADNAPL